MFCQNCGTALRNGVHFCTNCGSVQTMMTPEQPGTESPFAAKVLAAAKKEGSSPTFLVAAIFLTLTLVLNLLSLLLTNSAAAYETLLAELGLSNLALPDWLRTFTLAAEIIPMIPTILIAIGLWITYGTCVSRKPKANTAGLAIIFVVNLVQLVLSSLGLLTALLPFLVLRSHIADAFTQAMVLGAGLTVLAVFAFLLIYYIQLCTTISNIRGTLQTGSPNKHISRFVAIMCYIGSAFAFLSGIGGLFSACTAIFSKEFSLVAFLSPISSLLTGVAQVLFGVLLFSYRSKMEALVAEERMRNFRVLSYAAPYTSPVYIPPQPAPEVIPEPIAEEPEIIAEPEVTEEAEIVETPAITEEPSAEEPTE